MTDDIDALDELGLVAAVNGAEVQMPPGLSFLTTRDWIISGFTVNMNGSTLLPQLTGANERGVRVRSNAGIKNGTITVTGTGGGSGTGNNAPIVVGALYGESPTTGSISADEGVNNWYVENMTCSTTKDGACAVQVIGGAHNGRIKTIRVPNSSTMAGAHLESICTTAGTGGGTAVFKAGPNISA